MKLIKANIMRLTSNKYLDFFVKRLLIKINLRAFNVVLIQYKKLGVYFLKQEGEMRNVKLFNF